MKLCHITSLLGCAAMLTGCQTLLTVDIQPPRSVVRNHARVPSGEPTATLTGNSSSTKWTVDVRQPYTHIIDQVNIQTEGVRRYLWWPLAPLSGLLQCPMGLVAATISDSPRAKTLRQIGCMRLIGMEPLKGVAERQLHETIKRKQEEDDSPVAGIDVTFTPHRPDIEILRGLTHRDGLFTLTHASLLSPDRSPISGHLEVTGPHGKLISRTLTVSPAPARVQSTISLPPDYPVIVQINPFLNADGSPHPTLSATLTASLLQTGVCVIAGPRESSALLGELHFQMGMRIDDSAKVRNGRVKQPTLIIEGQVTTAEPTAINILIYVTQTGQRNVFEAEESNFAKTVVQQIGTRGSRCSRV